MTGGRFLERWSRLKTAAGQASDNAPAQDIGNPEALLAQLGSDSDFAAFLREEVSEAVRRQAMKKLFADPHFNVMDGLDVYIDDYSSSEPIPAAMLATLNQAKTLFETPPAGDAGGGSVTPADNAALQDGEILPVAGRRLPEPVSAATTPQPVAAGEDLAATSLRSKLAIPYSIP